jgi:hypothetical protein
MLIFMRILPISFLGAIPVVALSEDRVGSVARGKANGMAEFKDPMPGCGKQTGVKSRRTSPRFSQTQIPNLQDAKLPDGPVARLINISRGGILLETAEYMIPGGIVYLRLVAADVVFLLRGRVLRSHPALMRTPNPVYESAVSFDGNFPVPVEASAGSVAVKPAAMPPSGHESSGGESEGQTAVSGAQSPTAYTVTASVPRSGPDLSQVFGLNSW